jgi:hypothetical protein
VKPRAVIAIALSVLAVATAGMLARIEPFATSYYFFAWYATIAIADAWTHQRDRRRPMLLSQPAVFFSLLAWSALFWFSFELWNLRLANWYYVNVPDHQGQRWAGTVVAFATVLPGLFTIARLLGTYRFGDDVRTPPFRFTPAWLHFFTALGVVSGLLVLVWPGRFFPLVWGVTFFIIAPINYRRSGRGLLREVAAGRCGLVLRLLASGAICGFLWELFNIGARAKWIYTVPGFEELKIFEMPMLGFLGFPPFALECYEMYRAVVLARLARDWEEQPPREAAAGPAPAGPAPGSFRLFIQAATGLAAALLVVTSLVLMDRFTVDSMTPRPGDLPGVDQALAERLETLGVRDVASLPALLAETGSAERLKISDGAHRRLADQAELALLRGIGAVHTRKLVAVGVGTIEELARADAAGLEGWLLAVDPEYRPRPARLRVWIRAARARIAAEE